MRGVKGEEREGKEGKGKNDKGRRKRGKRGRGGERCKGRGEWREAMSSRNLLVFDHQAEYSVSEYFLDVTKDMCEVFIFSFFYSLNCTLSALAKDMRRR